MATAPQARAYLQDKTAAKPNHVVLDLTEVGFIGSHGFHLLSDAHQGLDDIHGQLHLIGVSSNRPVRRALDITGLAAVLDIEDDPDQLLRRLSG